MQNTVENLRKQGFKVFVRHYRFSNVDNRLHPLQECRDLVEKIIESRPKLKELNLDTVFNVQDVNLINHINPRGGKVEVEIITPKGESFKASTECSRNDNYRKTTGLQIALGRALKQIQA